MRRRFGVFLWLRCNEQARDGLVTRLRAHRGIQAAPQGDLVLVMSWVRARGAREACERFERHLSDAMPEDIRWTVAHQTAKRIRYLGGLRWGSEPDPDAGDCSGSP